ncbi:MAG: hypothetical protein U0572_03095 [Phycisphaerales bacterium]
MHLGSLRPLSAALAATLCCAAASADVIFVDIDQNLPLGSQTGTSWATAFKSLVSGLAAATSGDELWVAEGFYKPTTGTDRSIGFVIPGNVKVFGGFKGNEVNRNDRNPLLHATVLTGDIGVVNNNSDNSFRVVKQSGSNSLLSGLHITGGNANGGGGNNLGAGIAISANDTVVHECRIYGNQAVGAGAAILATAGGLTRITHCIITNNSGGAGLSGGGAVDLQNGTPSLFGCVIVNNPSGGAVRFLNTTGSESIANCIVRGNVGAGTTVEAQVQVTAGLTVTVSANNIEGAVAAGFGSNSIDADPKFADPDGNDDIPNNGDDNFALRGDSPCIDRGGTTIFPIDDADVDGDGTVLEFVPLDMARNTRRIDDPLITLTGPGSNPFPDIGAFEYNRPRTILVNHAATGANTGASWTDAYTDLQSAIAELTDIKFGGPGEIWVAKGTYKPSQTNDPLASFKLAKDMKIFGGFAGGENSRAARNPAVNETILSGEMGAAGPAGNSRTIVSANGNLIDENTILDGFTIKGGVSDIAFVAGSAINLANDAHPTIGGCRIVGNSNSVGSPVFCSGFGSAQPNFINCVIAGNTATANAGPGVIFTGSAGQLVNCVVAGNNGASNQNPAVRIVNSPAKLRGTVVFANTAGSATGVAAQVSAVGTNPVLAFTGIQNWLSGSVAGASETNVFDCGTDGDMVDANGLDNLFGTSDDDYSPAACSHLVDASSTQLVPDDLGDLDDDGNTTEEWAFDLVAKPRIVDLPAPNDVVGAQGRIDIGVIEAQSQVLADADFNDDGFVNGADLALLLGAWETVDTEFDLNGDCVVNAADLAVLLGAWT